MRLSGGGLESVLEFKLGWGPEVDQVLLKLEVGPPVGPGWGLGLVKVLLDVGGGIGFSTGSRLGAGLDVFLALKHMLGLGFLHV